MNGGLATGGLAYAAEVGAEVIQVFVSNPRGWATGPGDARQDRLLRACGLPVFVHAPYLINLGSGDPAVASKSASAVAHALQRGGEIGARGVVVHTGSAVGWAGREQALRQLGEIALPLLDKLGKDDPDLLFEPMAGQGQMLCAQAGDLAPYLAAVERHPKAGICLDTCHMFAAGHDLTAVGGVRAMLDELVAAAGPAGSASCTPTTRCSAADPNATGTRRSGRARSAPSRSANSSRRSAMSPSSSKRPAVRRVTRVTSLR